MPSIIKNENLKNFTNPDHTIKYIEEIFANAIVIDPAWMVECRKLGVYKMDDRSTQPADRGSTAQLIGFDEDDWQADLAQWTARQVLSAAPHGIGTFMAPALLNDRRATDKSVKRLVTICADFDTGNPKQQLEQLIGQLSIRPTFICESGGITKDGHMKLHAHWRLDEPCDEPWKVAYIREQLAHRFGADDSFKRIPQVIRVPGGLYDKPGQQPRYTEIIEFNDNDASMMDFEEFLNIDYEDLAEDSLFNPKNQTQNKTKEERSERLHQLHTEEVEEGRTTDTRWDRFSEYAGHQIRQARFGHQSIEEAMSSVKLWVTEKMVPPWEVSRVESEFRALLGKDQVNHADAWDNANKPPLTLNNAPVPANQSSATPESPSAQQPAAEKVEYGPDNPWLNMFRAKYLYAGEAPAERHLIDNFLVHGSSVGLVADGGVGKTYLALELALRAASGPGKVGGRTNAFLGFDIKEKMNVVVLTVEDNQHDIHRRICAIDPDSSLREAGGDSCMIVPVREQILDGLTLVEKDHNGNWGPSVAWQAINGHIDDTILQNPDLPLLVIIDTYSATHHGDENSATGTNEWFRASGLLRKHEATLLVTHHTRKPDQKVVIRTPSDMKAAIRGSTAFINSLRTIYGIWEMPNADAVLEELPQYEKGQRIFNMGMLKNNTGIDWSERSDPRYPDPMITLRRLGSGQLIYDGIIHEKRIELTENKKERLEASKRRLKASIRHIVRWYAEQQYPLSVRNVTREKETYLDPKVNSISIKDTEKLLHEMIQDGTISKLKTTGVNGQILDVPDGHYATAQQEGRLDMQPSGFQWCHYKYDIENEEYNELPNVQEAMDL